MATGLNLVAGDCRSWRIKRERGRQGALHIPSLESKCPSYRQQLPASVRSDRQLNPNNDVDWSFKKEVTISVIDSGTARLFEEMPC